MTVNRAGTAGKPILEVMPGRKLTNSAGGGYTLFRRNTAGNRRACQAYTSSRAAGLDHSKIITKIRGFKLKITTDYTGLGKIQYLLGQRGIKTLDSSYTDRVELTVLVPEEEEEKLRADIMDGTNGQAVMETGTAAGLPSIDGEIQIF